MCPSDLQNSFTPKNRRAPHFIPSYFPCQTWQQQPAAAIHFLHLLAENHHHPAIVSHLGATHHTGHLWCHPPPVFPSLLSSN